MKNKRDYLLKCREHWSELKRTGGDDKTTAWITLKAGEFNTNLVEVPHNSCWCCQYTLEDNRVQCTNCPLLG